MALQPMNVCIERREGKYCVSYQYSLDGHVHKEEAKNLVDALSLTASLLGEPSFYQKGVTDR